MRGQLFGSGETGWTGEQYRAFKDKAMNHGIVRKTVSYKDITLINEKLIEYSGVQFEMTENAFKALVRMLGLTTGVMETITKNLGENITAQLLKMMKVALAGDATKNSICLFVDKNSTKIVNFGKSAESVLSNNAFFTLFEETMNNQSGMVIKNMAITQEGNIEISVLNNNWEFQVARLNDEFFKSGLVFLNTPNETIIQPFAERLTCTNGNIATEKGLSLILKNADRASVNGFFDVVRNLKGVVNFEQEFKARIIRMMDTQASYAELLDVRSGVEYHVANMQDPDVRNMVETFIPTQYVKQAFIEKKVDLNVVDKKNYAKIRTMLTVWELLNKLTDLSSHPQRYGLSLFGGTSSIFALQRQAGELAFKKQYDLECSVPQIF